MIGIVSTHYRVEMETSHHKATKPGQHWTATSWHAYKVEAERACKKTAARARVVEVKETVIFATSEALIANGL